MSKKESKTIDLRTTPAFERMKSFLRSYRRCKTVCDEYVVERVMLLDREERTVRDEFYAECRGRCREVELFIKRITCTRDEKHLLWLHYVEGMSIEAVSERLYVSRSTAFRISRRAEEAALFAFLRYEREQRPPERIVS